MLRESHKYFVLKKYLKNFKETLQTFELLSRKAFDFSTLQLCTSYVTEIRSAHLQSTTTNLFVFFLSYIMHLKPKETKTMFDKKFNPDTISTPSSLFVCIFYVTDHLNFLLCHFIIVCSRILVGFNCKNHMC